MRVLITGGAGFIGSRLAKKLAAGGDVVTVVDSLSEQIHGQAASFDQALAAVARCIRGDVRDRTLIAELLASQETVVHLAAETGTGQSMYEVERYEDVNIHGTAILLDLIINRRPADLRKLVVASSRAIYGEGQYHCATHGTVFPGARTAKAMSAGQFEPVCPACGDEVTLTPTAESAPFRPSSFYGLTKQVQEQMVLMFARTLGLNGIALRYQNVYGPGQSLKNPYTGLLAVFSTLVRHGKPLNIFEDGAESRDFVFVDDVVDATAACLAPDVVGVEALNVGSGVRTSVLDVASAVVHYFGADTPITITGDFRIGDIRHNVADISRLKALMGFEPKWSFDAGLKSFLAWAEQENIGGNGFQDPLQELRDRNLMGLQAAR